MAALKAVEAGVDGIVVSNHGGRQLDYSPATITVLEEVNPIKLNLILNKLILLDEILIFSFFLKLQVVHVVRGRIPVLFDGGVRRGTDVFKALALGAQAVLVSF